MPDEIRTFLMNYGITGCPSNEMVNMFSIQVELVTFCLQLDSRNSKPPQMILPMLSRQHKAAYIIGLLTVFSL